MADEQTKQPEAPPQPAAKGGSALKTVLIVAVVLLLEGGTIIGTMMLSGGPPQVKGQGLQSDLEAELNKLVEIPLVDEKFLNMKTGRTMIYDMEVFITVRKKDSEQAKKQVESSAAQIKTAISTIVRQSEPTHFMEPTLATLTRQIQALMDERLGTDAEEQPILRDVLITRCIQLRAP